MPILLAYFRNSIDTGRNFWAVKLPKLGMKDKGRLLPRSRFFPVGDKALIGLPNIPNAM